MLNQVDGSRRLYFLIQQKSGVPAHPATVFVKVIYMLKHQVLYATMGIGLLM
jgi:hypothetical protein